MLEKILLSCEYVMKNSKHVKINYSKLDSFIKNIKCKELKNWLLYNPYNLLELDVETIINFLLVFESIDYSFFGEPKWTVETDEGFKDGSDALLYVLLKYVKETGSTDFSNMSFNDFKNILSGNVEIPLLDERYKTIVNVSKIVNEKMNGSFYSFVRNEICDISLFNIIITNFSSFKDERIYDGQVVYFYKLAQLLTSDILHVREALENIGVDYSNLIGCADYKIPQTLRALEIVEYSDELASIVDNKTEIDVSSKYEVEIRASQLVVIEYIKERFDNVKAIDINDFLFLYSKKVKGIVKPYHLCRNTNY